MDPTKSNRSLVSFLRYPVAFGTLLVLIAVSFKFRQTFLGDLENDRNLLYRGTDVEGAKLLKERILEMRKLKGQ